MEYWKSGDSRTRLISRPSKDTPDDNGNWKGWREG